MPIPAYKRCSRCDQTKPRAEFHKAPSMADGLLAWCKTCKRAYDARYRAGVRIGPTPWSLRFLKYVGGEDSRGCVTWIGHIGNPGYGALAIGSTHRSPLERAHRLAYVLVKGPIPAGHHVHHRCGNKVCVNPNHLETMTKSEHHRLHARSGQ